MRSRPFRSESGGIRVLKRVNRALDHLEERLIATLIAAATALIFVSVLHRYGTGVSINLSKWAAARGVPFVPEILKDIYLWLAALDLSWAQELCIYMFIWMAKFGAAYGVRTGIHVGVDLLVNMVPARSRKQVILFSLLCGAFFTGMIATFGGSFVEEMFKTGQQSNDLEAPMWIVYLAIPLGSGLMCFRFLQVAWFYYWIGELPHHNEAQVEGIDTNVPALHPASASPAEVSRSKSSPLGLILILAPILILTICLGEKAGIIVLPQALRAATIFLLLIALMLTGIPVSIALGLTVLTFLFTLTTVPIEAVSMKLFTGIESFEIMAIPFFILAGNRDYARAKSHRIAVPHHLGQYDRPDSGDSRDARSANQSKHGACHDSSEPQSAVPMPDNGGSEVDHPPRDAAMCQEVAGQDEEGDRHNLEAFDAGEQLHRHRFNRDRCQREQEREHGETKRDRNRYTGQHQRDQEQEDRGRAQGLRQHDDAGLLAKADRQNQYRRQD